MTVHGGASGTYNVVPYVVVAGKAYTGGVFAAGDGTSDSTQAALQVTVTPHALNANLALAPAVTVLVLSAVLYVLRRAIVR